MSFYLFQAGTAQRHAMIQRYVIANFRRLTDDNAHPVIDEKVVPDGRARVDFNPCQTACRLGDPARNKLESAFP